MFHVRTFALAGTVMLVLSLAGMTDSGCDSQAFSTGAQLYQASIDPLPLLSGL